MRSPLVEAAVAEPSARGMIEGYRPANAMTKLLAPALLFCLLAGCATEAPRQPAGCIPGDPGGSQACQAVLYLEAR